MFSSLHSDRRVIRCIMEGARRWPTHQGACKGYPPMGRLKTLKVLVPRPPGRNAVVQFIHVSLSTQPRVFTNIFFFRAFAHYRLHTAYLFRIPPPFDLEDVRTIQNSEPPLFSHSNASGPAWGKCLILRTPYRYCSPLPSLFTFSFFRSVLDTSIKFPLFRISLGLIRAICGMARVSYSRQASPFILTKRKKYYL